MLVVAGLSLRNLHPRVWDPASPFYLADLAAVMVSYGEFHQMPTRRALAMQQGLRAYLDLPPTTALYLDNGAFYFASQSTPPDLAAYGDFVSATRPDWKPIPQDYIPIPKMSAASQRSCFERTMDVNRVYHRNGYVPVVHIGRHLHDYTRAIQDDTRLAKKTQLALGAIVPNLLRKPKAIPYSEVLAGLIHVRTTFPQKAIHVFGIGGTATLHLAALVGFDSVDSSGWRNRAARGIVQLPGSGDRLVADLGKWRGRQPTDEEWQRLRQCGCPACRQFGTTGITASKLHGFCCRATHNLWVLLQEERWLAERFARGTYRRSYRRRLDNSTYQPLIEELLDLQHTAG